MKSYSQRPRLGPAAVSALGLVLCAVTAAVTLSGSHGDEAWLEALARASTVGAPIGVGVYALRRPQFARFGRLLVLGGVAWFLTTLSGSDESLLYSVGRVSSWLAEPVLVFLVLAFPSGRVEGRIDRALVWGVTLLALTLYMPTALFVEAYPVPAPYTSCDAGCPANAFMVTAGEPALIEDVVRPLRDVLTIALFAAVAVRLADRIRGATTLTRRTLTPVLGVACFRGAAFAAVVLGRRIAPDSAVVEVALWLLALAIPLLAAAFLLGLVRWWVFIARSTQRLAHRLRDHPDPEDLRAALADAFEDPELEIVYCIGDGTPHWADAAGHRLHPPPPPPGRCLTEIRDGREAIAGIVHDPALGEDRAFVDTATSYALMTLENHRLSAQASSLLREVSESRVRIRAAADDERRRIERDLHDGAQQRLIALRIKLELAAERTGDGRGAGAALLRSLGDEVVQALEEVRSLARGTYQAPLAERGLVEGLRAVALANALPTTVVAAGVGRYSREIESAAYFVCLEALQNAGKHAYGATVAVIDVSDNGSLRLEVRDDGAGFDPGAATDGVGLAGMRDRLAAVGGDLRIASSPGRGTRITGSIPLGTEAA